MEKLTKINSILFTIMSSLLIIASIIILFTLIDEFFPNRGISHNSEIISNEEIAKLVKENKRAGIITYQTASLIDSAKQIYLVPVSQIKLKDIEDIPQSDHEIMALEIATSDISYHYSYGGFQLNNIVIIDLRNDHSNILFRERTSIVDYHTFSQDNKSYILMLVCSNDSNNDKLLNRDDLLEVLLYDFELDKMIKLSEKVEHFLDITFMRESDEIFIDVGIDRNNDKKFDRIKEPTIIKRVDIKNKKLINLVDGDLSVQLQEILDGK